LFRNSGPADLGKPVLPVSWRSEATGRVPPRLSGQIAGRGRSWQSHHAGPPGAKFAHPGHPLRGTRAEDAALEAVEPRTDRRSGPLGKDGGAMAGRTSVIWIAGGRASRCTGARPLGVSSSPTAAGTAGPGPVLGCQSDRRL